MTGIATPRAVVDRDAELRLLRRLLRQLRAGRGRAVWVEGEPGVGKSTLITAGLVGPGSAGLLGPAGCRVLRAAADPLAQLSPLRLLLDCLGLPSLVDLFTPQPPGSGGLPSLPGVADPAVAGAERLVEQVERWCAESPVLLVADDLQWADEASLEVWARLAQVVEQLPLLLVGACRPVPRRAELTELRKRMIDVDAVVLTVAPLPPASVDQMVGGLVGRPGTRLRQMLARAAGNPLYVREFVDALRREEALRVAQGVAELADQDPAVPATLSAAIADRLAFLSEPTMRVLRVAALLGTEFSRDDLVRAADCAATVLVEPIGEALAAGVLSETEGGSRLAFRHGLVHEALYESIPGPVRTALHRQIAAALAEAGAVAERVAAQLLAARPLVDPWVLAWLAQHAQVLVQRAPQLAARLLEHAVQSGPQPDPRWLAVEAALVHACFLLARHEQVERWARPALARDRDPGQAAAIAWDLAYTLIRTNRHDEAQRVGTDMAERLPPRDPWRARLAAAVAAALFYAGRIHEAELAAKAVVAEAKPAGDPMATGFALLTLSLVAADEAQRLPYLERALAVVGDDPATMDLRLLLMGNYANSLERLGQAAEAERALRTTIRLAEQVGTPRLGLLRLFLAGFCYRQGRWDEAHAEIESIAELPSLENWGTLHSLAAVMAAHRDDVAAATMHLSALDKVEDPGFGSASVTRAILAERDQQPERARQLLTALLDIVHPVRVTYVLCAMPALVRLALETGDRATAEAAAAFCADVADHDPTPRNIGMADHCRGLLAVDPVQLLAAAGRLRAVGEVAHLGTVLEDTAVVLAEQGDTAKARACYLEAVDVYLGLGADRDLRRADARLRAVGIRRGQRGPRRRPTSGWAALTPTERHIADLVAAGKSNPDIANELLLSRRTVQTHVSHILAKLNVRSRVEVASQAATQEPRD